MSNSLTILQQRIIDAAVEIHELAPDTPEFLHSVLCQAGLPRKHTNERVFERNNGRAGILIEAGRLYKAGKYIELPLPYGVKPRLAIIHISSEAVRTKCREIDIGESIRELLIRLNLPTNGPTYTEMKRQMERLAACRMVLGMSTGNRDITINTQPITRFEAWLNYDGKQRSMWPGVLELSQEFFDTLQAHAVPLDPRALVALKKSALALDIYTWLAHRLCRVRKPSGTKLSWQNLKTQFGQEYRVSKDFKKMFRKELAKVRTVYPDARIEEVIGGLLLKPSAPPVPKTQVLVSLPT